MAPQSPNPTDLRDGALPRDSAPPSGGGRATTARPSRPPVPGTATGDLVVRHRALTVLARIRPTHLGALRDLLAQIAHETATPPAGPLMPFAKIPTLHFARLAILEKEGDAAREVHPMLLFATDFDGETATHLDDLTRELGRGLHAVFGHCEGYPPVPGPSAVATHAYLQRHSRSVGAHFVGTPGRSVERIRLEDGLRRTLEQWIDETPGPASWRTLTPDDPRRTFLARLAAGTPHTPLSLWPVATPFARTFDLRRDGRLALVALAAALATFAVWIATALLARRLGFGSFVQLAAGPTLLTLGAAALAGALRWKETHDREYHRAEDPTFATRLAKLTALEDHGTQNQMTSLSDIKPGWLRYTILTLMLWVTDWYARHKNFHGQLAGIPSIHFARWIVVPGQRRLLFVSNYDGSFEGYLGDFVDHAACGLTAIWSNAVGFPRTRWLFRGGAQNEHRFKAVARANQVPTQVWYRAYPSLSVGRINTNTRIREGLSSNAKVDTWLRRF